MVTSTAMRVLLAPPPGWDLSRSGDAPTARAPAPREVALQLGAMIVTPEDVPAWHREAARADLVDAARATPIDDRAVIDDADRTFTTETGWRATALPLAITAPDGALVEYRLVVVYEFLHTLACVLVRSHRDLAELGADDVRAALRSAQPDFRTDEPIALAELWD